MNSCRVRTGARAKLDLTCAAAGLLLFASTSPAATTSTWQNAVSGNWTDPTKWSTNPNYPNNGTPAGTTYDAMIDQTGSAYTVTLPSISSATVDHLTISSPVATFTQMGSMGINFDSTLTLATYNFGGATLSGAGNVTVNGNFSWTTNGSLIGAGGIIGQMGCSIDVGRGRVMAVYNRRDATKPGVWAVVSCDGGRTWPQGGHVALWDARGRAIFGSTGEDNRSKSLYDEGLFAFGKPDAVALADGTFLVGFWCCANFVSHMRYASVAIA